MVLDTSALLAHGREPESEPKLNEADLTLRRLQDEENRGNVRSYREHLGEEIDFSFLREAITYLRNPQDKNRLPGIRAKIDQKFAEVLSGINILLNLERLV